MITFQVADVWMSDVLSWKEKGIGDETGHLQLNLKS